jgi:hypothetical protein
MKSKRRPVARIRLAPPEEPASHEIEMADIADASTLEPLLRDPVLHEIRAALSPDGENWKLHTRRLQLASSFRIVDEVQPIGLSLRVFWSTGDPGVHLQPCEPEGESWTEELAEQKVGDLPWVSLVSDMPSRAGKGEEPSFPCRLGASRPSRMSWRYLRDREAKISMEVEWSLPDLPRDWLAVLEARLEPTLACRADDLDLSLRLDTSRSDLIFRGTAALGKRDSLPAKRSFTLHPPVDLADPAAGEKVFKAVAMSTEIRDFVAVIRGEKTRYISGEEDLDEPVKLLLRLAPRDYLPPLLPPGVLQPEGVFPWDFEVSEEQGEWLLAGASSDGTPRTWKQMDWPGGPLIVGIGCRIERSSPALQRITNRKVKRGWEPADGKGGPGTLEVLRAAWWPRGLDESLFRAEDGAYDGTVSLKMNDLVERFAVDGVSELPEEPLFLDPYRWRVRNDAGTPVSGVRIYGHADGSVWWLFTRSPDRPQARVPPTTPAVWAAESSPVLLIRDLRTSQRCWGGLFIPSSPPAEHDLQRLRSVTSAGGAEMLISEESTAFLWIYLRGFFERYEIRRVELAGEPVSAWVGVHGLPLFPASSQTLLRSLSPLYAVEGNDDELALDADPERPTLRIGRSLLRMDGVRTIRPGLETRYRYAWTPDARTVPERWELRIAGEDSPLSPPAESPVFWLALQPFEDQGEVPFRFLLSWDAQWSWRFRGFYAPVGKAVRLGLSAPNPRERRPVLLRSRSGEEAELFLLTVVSSGGAPSIRWSPTRPEGVEDAEVILWFQKDDLRPHRRPQALQRYQVGPVRRSGSTIELELWVGTGGEHAKTEPGIQVWAPLARAGSKVSGAGQEGSSGTLPAAGHR